MIDKLIEQQEQIKAMQENEDSAIKIMKMYEECRKRINKAIEYIENHSITNIEWWITGQQKIECKFTKDTNPQELLEILDKENKE